MKVKKNNTELPAAQIILAFESIHEYGDAYIATHLGIRRSTVQKWAYPLVRKGSGGRIPIKYHQRLIELAAERGFELKPSDFFIDQNSFFEKKSKLVKVQP